MANAAKGKKVRTRRKERKNIEKGAVHISSSFNNTMVTITDTQGRTRGHYDQGRHPHSAQWLPSSETPPRLIEGGK